MLGENEDHVCGLPDGRSRSSVCSTTRGTFERAESVRPFIQTSASLSSCDSYGFACSSRSQGPSRPSRGRPDTMLTAGSSFRNAPLAWRDRDLCQSAAAGMLRCEEAASLASFLRVWGLLGPERAVLGSCMTAVSMVLSPMRPF